MKTSIVIANTLKPVDDVRAFEKVAVSIAKTNKYEVNIIGNSEKKETESGDIKFHPHLIPGKTLIRRVALRFLILQRLFRLKPDVLVVTTHELLFISVLIKTLCGSKIIYDVQEDYRKNLLFISKLPRLLRSLLALSVRTKERLLTPFIDAFWLAEKCYSYEIGFPKSRSVVIENKAQELPKSRGRNTTFKFLFSGTISNYGQVLLAVAVYQKIAKEIPDSSLAIVGQCHDNSLLKKLRKLAESDRSIALRLSKEMIPHSEILEQIFEADVGIISYQVNPVNENKIPTKLYEYSQYELPYLIQMNTAWEQKSKKLGGALPIDFFSPDVSFILDTLEKRDDLFSGKYPETEIWQSQELAIYDSLNALLYSK